MLEKNTSSDLILPEKKTSILDMIRKITGKNHSNAIKHLSINNCIIITKKNITDQPK